MRATVQKVSGRADRVLSWGIDAGGATAGAVVGCRA